MKTNVPMLWRLKDAKRYMGGNKQPNMILMSVIFFISVKAERELRPKGTSRAAKSRSTYIHSHLSTKRKWDLFPRKMKASPAFPKKETSS